MPRGAAPQRAEEMAAMESILHARRMDPAVADWLEAIDAGLLDDVGRANLRHIKRSYARTAKVPAALAAELAKTPPGFLKKRIKLSAWMHQQKC
mgnify:CR=1 FL=1